MSLVVFPCTKNFVALFLSNVEIYLYMKHLSQKAAELSLDPKCERVSERFAQHLHVTLLRETTRAILRRLTPERDEEALLNLHSTTLAAGTED